MSENSNTIFALAKKRGEEWEVSYAGVVTPAEAHLLCNDGEANLIDVRTRAELAYVGRIAIAVAIEWQIFPGMEINSRFEEELKEKVATDKPTLFICRSGVRSHHAATVAQQLGYVAYNVIEGFEGDLNDNGHRNTINGWRAGGLPWVQS